MNVLSSVSHVFYFLPASTFSIARALKIDTCLMDSGNVSNDGFCALTTLIKIKSTESRAIYEFQRCSIFREICFEPTSLSPVASTSNRQVVAALRWAMSVTCAPSIMALAASTAASWYCWHTSPPLWRLRRPTPDDTHPLIQIPQDLST